MCLYDNIKLKKLIFDQKIIHGNVSDLISYLKLYTSYEYNILFKTFTHL